MTTREEKLPRYYAQVDTLEDCEKNCDLGDCKMVQVFMYPHKDMLGSLVPLIKLSEHNELLKEARAKVWEEAASELKEIASKLNGEVPIWVKAKIARFKEQATKARKE